MRMLVRPAKREGSESLIFDCALSDDHVFKVPSGITVSIIADPIHRGRQFGDKSQYRYNILFSPMDMAKITDALAARGGI